MPTFQKSLPQDALFVKVTRTIARPVPETFAYIVPVDVTHIISSKWRYAGQCQHHGHYGVGPICRSNARYDRG